MAGWTASATSCVEQPERVQFAHRVRQQVDAHAQRADLVDRLVHLHVVAGLVQAQRRHQPADAGTHHHDRAVPRRHDLVHVDGDVGRPPLTGGDGDDAIQPFPSGADVWSRMWVRK